MSSVIASLKANIETQKRRVTNGENAFDHALKHLDPDKPEDQGLIAILNDIDSIRCTFCKGAGHHAGRCSSKKNVDDAVKHLPNVRKLWGTMKSTVKSTGKRTSVKRVASAALENYTAFAVKGQKRAKKEPLDMQDVNY